MVAMRQLWVPQVNPKNIGIPPMEFYNNVNYVGVDVWRNLKEAA